LEALKGLAWAVQGEFFFRLEFCWLTMIQALERRLARMRAKAVCKRGEDLGADLSKMAISTGAGFRKAASKISRRTDDAFWHP
jgi:hypothetical protein